jgi:hypothetical protein
VGTWDASILGNDTSAEVYEAFFEAFNRGDEIAAIDAMIDERFATSIGLDEDRANVLFARALAHWEIGTLSRELLREARDAVAGALDACRSLGADEVFLRQRSRALDKLLIKLSTPRPKPKKRKKPPVPLVTELDAGACLAFLRPDGRYGGVVAVSSSFFARRGSLSLIATSLAQRTVPTFADFEAATLHGFEWEAVSGQAAKFASPNGKTGRVDVLSIGYDGGNENRKAFFARLRAFFEVVGRVPLFTQILATTTGHSLGAGDEYVKNLAKALAQQRDDEQRRVSREPLRELAVLLSTRR